MTGPEHYQEAERLIAGVSTQHLSFDELAVTLGLAQTHATLAHAAATALGGVQDPDRWLEVAG